MAKDRGTYSGGLDRCGTYHTYDEDYLFLQDYNLTNLIDRPYMFYPIMPIRPEFVEWVWERIPWLIATDIEKLSFWYCCFPDILTFPGCPLLKYMTIKDTVLWSDRVESEAKGRSPDTLHLL